MTTEQRILKMYGKEKLSPSDFKMLNKIICEFMDFDNYQPNDYLIDIPFVEAEIYSINNTNRHPMSFHWSYDWIMPVIDKIREHESISKLEMSKESFFVCTKGDNWRYWRQPHKGGASLRQAMYLVTANVCNYFNKIEK